MSEQPLEPQPTAPASDEASHEGETSARLIPVGEAIKYRRRAQQAETRLQEIEKKLTDALAQLDTRMDQLATAEAQRDEMQHAIEAQRTRTRLERVLYGAGVVDVEAAATLLDKQADLGESPSDQQLDGAIARLLQDKPYLLARAPEGPQKTASARVGEAGAAAGLNRAATKAAGSGSRRDLVDYLRLRRQAMNA